MVLQTSCRGGWQHSKANNLLIKPFKLVFKIGQNFPKALTPPCNDMVKKGKVSNKKTKTARYLLYNNSIKSYNLVDNSKNQDLLIKLPEYSKLPIKF